MDLADEDGTYSNVVSKSLTVSAMPIDDNSVNEGSPYTLKLSNDLLFSNMTWTINWGDWGNGLSQNVSNVSSVTHIYADGPQQYSIDVQGTGWASKNQYQRYGFFKKGGSVWSYATFDSSGWVNGAGDTCDSWIAGVLESMFPGHASSNLEYASVEWQPCGSDGSLLYNARRVSSYAEGDVAFPVYELQMTEHFHETAVVTNVAPTATLANSGPVNEGSTATVSFGGQHDPSPLDIAAGFHYAFDLDNDGIWDAGDGTYANSSTDSSTIVAANYLTEGPGTQVVKGRIIDKDGDYTDYTTTIVVNNVAPSATLSNSGPVNEGSTATVSFGSQYDPSSLDTAAEFRYAFDFNNDGTWDVGDGTYGNSSSDSSVTVLASFLADGPSLVVKGWIIDKDGGYTDYTTTITINNVDPIATLTNGGAVNEGSTATVSFGGQYDPSTPDVTAGFHYAFDFDNDGVWDFGDGTYAHSSVTASMTVPAKYLADGDSTREVKGRILDKDGGFNDYTTSITINNVNPTATLTNNGPVREDSPATVTFINSSDRSTADVTAGFHYAFDVNHDGLWEFGDGTYAGSSTTASAPVAASYLEDPGTWDVIGRIIDKDGSYTNYTTTIIVSNVVPTATLTNGGSVNEGSTGTVTFSNPSDPDCHYAFDFDNDGTWDVGDGTYAGSSATASAPVAANYLADGLSTRTVKGRVIDADGDCAEYTTEITIFGVAPTLSVAENQTVNAGQLLSLTNLGVFTDPGFSRPQGNPVTCETFTYSIDWGDETTPSSGAATIDVTGESGVLTQGSFDGSHTYTVSGLHTVTVILTDDDGDSDTKTFQVTVVPQISFVLTDLDLLYDTSTSPETTIASDPTITGLATQGSTPVVGARIQLDIDDDGVTDAYTQTDSTGHFTYFPTDLAYGVHTIQARGVEWNTETATDLYGPWISLTFTYQIGLPPAIAELELANDNGSSSTDTITSDPTLRGSVDISGAGAGTVTICLDLDNDGIAEEQTQANAVGHFLYRPTGLSSNLNPITVQVCASWKDPATGNDLYGPWTSIEFTYYVTPSAPALTDLRLANDTGAFQSDNISNDDTLTGRLDSNAAILQNVTIEFDVDGNFVVDGTTVTDATGHFTFAPTNLPVGTNPITVHARSSVHDSLANTDIKGAWRSFTFTYYSASTPPAVTTLQLANDTGSSNSDKITTDSTLTGQIGTATVNVNVQFATGDDNTIIGNASTNDAGQFTFQPVSLVPDANPITVRARTYQWDNIENAYSYSSWQSLTFTYSAAPYVVPSVTTLSLVNTIGRLTYDQRPIVTDPKLTGQVNGGSVAYLTVEFDDNGDGKAEGTAITDASGKFTYTPSSLTADDVVIHAWVHAWDYTQNAYVDSEEKTISFRLEVVAKQASTIADLYLQSPIGTNGTLITANTMIVGHIAEKLSGVAIQFKHVGDDTLDGTAITDVNGDFYFQPTYLPFGPVTVQARTIQWDETQGTYLVGTWQQLTFDHQERASTAAVLVELELANQIGTLGGKPVATDPTLTGQIHVQDNDALEGVTIELDFTGDGVVDQFTTTDVLGNFSITPEGLSYGLDTIYVRTRKSNELTHQVFVSDWTTSNVSPFSFLYLESPRINELAESRDPVTGATQVTGQVSIAASIPRVWVEFDNDGDFAAETWRAVNETGHFTYQSTSSNLLYARVVESVGGSSPLYGKWQAVTPDTDTLTAITSISQLALAGTAVNGATNSGAINGQVTGQGNLEQGTTVTVEFDIDGDGSNEYNTSPDQDGNFAYNHSCNPGLMTVAARTCESTGSAMRYSNWMYLRFYYTNDDPNSAESQAAVAALNELDPDWQTHAGDTSGNSTPAQNTTQAAYDQAIQTAQTTHDTLIQQADVAYQAAIKAADIPYTTAIATAGQTFASDLAAYTGDQTTAVMTDFVWPSAPANQSLTIPDDSTQPQSPAQAPTYDGPDFDLTCSNRYTSLLENAQTVYNKAERIADDAFSNATTSAYNTYDAKSQNVWKDYEAEKSMADAAYDDATSQNSLTLSDYGDIQDAYQEKCYAADTAYYEATTTSLNIYNEVTQQNQSTYNAASVQAHNDCVSRNNNNSLQIKDSDKLDYANEQSNLICSKAIAAYACQLAKANADAEQQKAYRDAEALNKRDDALADAQWVYDRDMAGYNMEVRNQRLAAQQAKDDAYAAAQWRYANRIADAVLEKANALADAALEHSNALAIAQMNLWQDTASAKKQAIDAWSAASGRTPWTEYKLVLACNEVAYYNALRSRYLAQAASKAEAVHNESLVVAGYAWTHADAVADADYQWAVMRAQADYDYGVGSSGASRDQDCKMADASRVYQDVAVQQQELRTKAIADAVHKYADTIAPVAKVYSISTDEARCDYAANRCSFEAYQYACARAIYTLETKTNEASRDSGREQIDANEACSKALSDAAEQYEFAYATAVKERAEAIADLAGSKEIAYAQAEQDYTNEMLSSTADRDKQVAEAGKNRKITEAQANETYAIGDGEDDLGEAGLSYKLKCDNAASKEAFQNAVASNYVTIVSNWDAARKTPWTNYQLALAKAEQSHIRDLGDAEVQYAIATGGADIVWTITVVRAEEDCAEAIAGAELKQSQDVADAIKTQGEDIVQARFDYAKAVANATTEHDKGVAADNKTYHDALAGERNDWANALDDAEFAYDRSRCEAWYAYANAEYLAIRDCALGTITGTAEQEQFDAASEQYHNGDNGIDKAKSDTAMARAWAFEAHANSMALAYHNWVDATSTLDAGWAGDIADEAITLAGEIRDHTIALATAQAGVAKQYATTVADAVKAQSITTADADQTYSNSIATADTAYNTRYDTADSDQRMATAKAQGDYEVALYKSHAAVLRYAAEVLGTPLAAYQAAAAAANEAWAEARSLARNQHEQAMTVAYASQTTAVNTATLNQIRDQATADHDYALLMAGAERDWSIAFDSAEADRQLTIATAAAIKASNDIVAQAEYRDAQAGIECHFAQVSADAEVTWTANTADAEAAWTADIVAAANILRTSEHTANDSTDFNNAAAQATTDRQAAIDVADMNHNAAIHWVDYHRVGEIGDAQIALATALGGSVVGQAQDIGDAGIAYATAMNTADTAYAATSVTAENTYAVDTAPVDSDYDYYAAMAQRDLTTAAGVADVAYQQQLGLANVNYAGRIAGAEATYQLAVANANATKASIWANIVGTDNARLRATAAAGYAAWIQATGSYFVAYQTASAQAAANYDNAQAIATAQASNAQAAADLAYTDATAAPTESNIILSTAAEQLEMSAQVGRDNIHRSALATADAGHVLADAQANRQHAIALAQAEKAYWVACSDAQVQFDVALAQNDPDKDADYSNAISVAGTSKTVAVAKAERDLIVGIDLTEDAHVLGQAEADLQWSNGVAEADKTLAENNATAAKALVVTLAGYDYTYATAISSLSGDCDRAYTTAQIAAWNQETTAENLWNTQTTTANADFITASYSQAVSVTANMVTTMIETNAPGIDWAQFQAGLATAKANWWAVARSNYIQNAANANALTNAYQTEVNTRYQTQADATIAAAATQTEAKAMAEKTRQIAQSEAERACSVTIAGLTEVIVKAYAQASHDCTDNIAEAKYDRDIDYNWSVYNTTTSNAYQAEQVAKRAATIAYALGTSVAEGKRDVAKATADLAYENCKTSADPIDIAYTKATAAATKEYTEAEAAAYATLRIGNAALNAAFSEQQADTYADAIAAFAAANATPWSAFEATRADAADTRQTAVIAAMLAHENGENGLANLDKQLEINKAAADEIFANANATANFNSRVINATSDLLTTTIQAAKHVGWAVYNAVWNDLATTPETKASDLVSGVSTSDYRMSSYMIFRYGTAYDAHNTLIKDIYNDYWDSNYHEWGPSLNSLSYNIFGWSNYSRGGSFPVDGGLLQNGWQPYGNGSYLWNFWNNYGYWHNDQNEGLIRSMETSENARDLATHLDVSAILDSLQSALPDKVLPQRPDQQGYTLGWSDWYLKYSWYDADTAAQLAKSATEVYGQFTGSMTLVDVDPEETPPYQTSLTSALDAETTVLADGSVQTSTYDPSDNTFTVSVTPNVGEAATSKQSGVQWDSTLVNLYLEILDPDVARFWTRYSGRVESADKPGFGWRLMYFESFGNCQAPSADYSVKTIIGDDTFAQTDKVWAKVPDGWDSEEVAQYIVSQCATANGALAKRFNSFLFDKANFDRAVPAEEARVKAGLRRAGDVAEIGTKIMASLIPGGNAVVAVSELQDGNYKTAAFQMALMVPYGKLLEKGCGFIRVEMKGVTSAAAQAGEEAAFEISMEGLKAFQQLSPEKQMSLLQRLGKAKNWDEAIRILNTATSAQAAKEFMALNGLKGVAGELALAKRLSEIPNLVVVKMPNMPGLHGADVITVDKITGQVTLYDAKFVGSARNPVASKTFADEGLLKNALRDAEKYIRGNSILTAAIKAEALKCLKKGDYRLITAGEANAMKSILQKNQ